MYKSLNFSNIYRDREKNSGWQEGRQGDVGHRIQVTCVG
jgi:hypothetical protein